MTSSIHEDRAPIRAGGVVDEDGALADSLGRLSRLAPEELTLKAFLQEVVACAAAAVPGAVGSALSLQIGERSETAVFTTGLAAEVDALQYNLGQGPCLDAAREGGIVVSGALGDDRRWPVFSPQAAALGVYSALSLPLTTPDGVVGTLNLYAHARDAFSERSVVLAELFAVPAAIAVRNAQALAHVKDLATQLQIQVNGAKAMDETIGLLISRYQESAGDLLRRLRAREALSEQ